jgi:hypothetical protein
VLHGLEVKPILKARRIDQRSVNVEDNVHGNPIVGLRDCMQANNVSKSWMVSIRAVGVNVRFGR